MKIKTHRIADIDYTVLSALCTSTIPLTVTVTVIDMDDPHDVSHTALISVVTDRLMKHFLAEHYNWRFLYMDEEITTNEVETYFSYIWNDFVVRHKDDMEKAVQAEQIVYNPAMTFFRDETGDSDKITYGAIQVANSGGISTSHTKMKGQTTPSIGSADTDGYRSVTVNGISAASEGPTTTNSVTTYDDSSTPSTSTTSESVGDTASESGSTSSAKTTTGGSDTHSRDMHFEGSDALHTSTQMVEAEINMRLGLHIGRRFLEMFADEYLFGCVGGGCDE